jgi:hypothetical protein
VLAVPMSDEIPSRFATGRAYGPTLAARADKPEADTTEPVAAELERVSPDLDRDDAASMEHERQARLRRWQTPAVRK